MDDFRRRFFRLARVNVLTNITVPLAGLVDTAMLGHLSDIRFLAGVALGTVVFDYLYWSLGFLRMGATGLTAQAVGAGGKESPGVYLVLQRSLALAAMMAVVILLFRHQVADLTFSVLAGEPGVKAEGVAYYDARIWGAPAVLLNLAFLGWFLGREESRIALAMTAVASVANIVLDYLFILRWDMAAYGAGLATMASQYLMLLTALAFYLRLPGRIPWSPRQIFDRGRFLGLLKLQGDILIRTLCLVTSFAVFVQLSALLGTVLLAANTLLTRILSFAAFFIDGAAFATETLTGIFHGAGRRDELRRLLRLALASGLALGALCALVVVVVPGPILGLLTSHRDVVDLAADHRWWLAATLVPGSLAYILDGYFIGLAAGRTLRLAMLASTFLAFLPLAAAAWHLSSSDLIWAAMAAFMVARTVTLGGAAVRQLRPQT